MAKLLPDERRQLLFIFDNEHTRQEVVCPA
jgi:hypothetical protein